MPVPRSLAVDSSFHDVGESANDRIIALLFSVVGAAFCNHGDPQGGGTSRLPSFALCVTLATTGTLSAQNFNIVAPVILLFLTAH